MLKKVDNIFKIFIWYKPQCHGVLVNPNKT